jgi:hypothetical protein
MKLNPVQLYMPASCCIGYERGESRSPNEPKNAGCLNDLVWRNKYMRKETKSKIYKATVRPIMTYALETRAET